MFEASVDDFGRAITGVGVVEVGQDVPGSGACLIVCVSVFCLKGLMHDE